MQIEEKKQQYFPLKINANAKLFFIEFDKMTTVSHNHLAENREGFGGLRMLPEHAPSI